MDKVQRIGVGLGHIGFYFMWWWAYQTVAHDIFKFPSFEWFQAYAAYVLVTSIGGYGRYVYHMTGIPKD